MDWVQIYYLCWMIFVVFLVSALAAADKPKAASTWRSEFFRLPARIIIGLPMIGRVFNWW